MARVIISAGHTNSDPGTVINNLREVDVARTISRAVIPYLRFNGIVALVVPYDLTLDRRIAWINSTGYKEEFDDILVEVHANEGGNSGIEAWYHSRPSGKSLTLAQKVTTSISNDTGLKIQGVKDETTHPIGGINLLKDVAAVPLLLECLYLDNDSDRKFLADSSKVEVLARSIARGIAQYLGIDFKDPKPELKTLVEEKKNGKEEDKDLADKPEVKSQPQTQPQPQVQNKPKEQLQVQTQPQPRPQKPEQRAPKQNFAAPSQNQNLSQSSRPVFGTDINDIEEDDDVFPIPTNPTNWRNPASTFPSSTANTFGSGSGGIGGYGGNPASSFGSNSMGGNFGSNPAGAGFGGNTMSRDDRREMIKKYYLKAFGKEPAVNDLNYFLNIGVTEEQLLKRIIESQDHLDIVNAAKEHAELKEKSEQLQTRLQTLERSLADQKEVMNKLNALLLQKNQSLSEMQRRVQLLVSKLEDFQQNRQTQVAPTNYKGTLKEQLFEYFSKKLS